MPRENRKRGKRKKNLVQDDFNEDPPIGLEDQPSPGEPSWIEQSHISEPLNLDAPFGLCDPDVKAYFRSVENQMKEWQELGIEGDDVAGEDQNLERRMFFSAALTEMQGKECLLATDPDCAVILERMVHSMDDLARRIFLNSLIGSIVELAKHRFGSHVLETLLESAAATINRETRGIFPAAQSLPQFAGQPTMSDLIGQLCQAGILQLGLFRTKFSPSLVNEKFASHVLQRLIVLLIPPLDVLQEKQNLRSKRSAGYKSKQGPLKSVFDAAPDVQQVERQTPSKFSSSAQGILRRIREKFSASEVRALAADKVACPTLRVLVALESALGWTNQQDSLMDYILVGMIRQNGTSPVSMSSESDYLATLLRDATASHLLETVIQHMPDDVFSQLWHIYFRGKLNRLAIHPVANFVVANAFERLNKNDFPAAVQEMDKVLAKSFKQHRIGPVTSLVKRAGAINTAEEEVVNEICASLGIDSNDPTGLIGRILEIGDVMGTAESSNGDVEPNTAEFHPSVQGALLLQSMLLLSSPHNEVVIKSFERMSKQAKVALAHDATSSRVIDAMLDSPVVTRKTKRSVIMAYIGQYEQLVNDRIGSRVGDRCWMNSDPYLKEKIARSLIPHQQSLASSYYGKFFAKKLQLSLLLRKPDEWRLAQIRSDEKKPQSEAAQNRNNDVVETPNVGNMVTRREGKEGGGVVPGFSSGAKRGSKRDRDDDDQEGKITETSDTTGLNTKRGKKRKREENLNEIDVLFSGVKENRFSKLVPPSSYSDPVTSGKQMEGKDSSVSDLDLVLRAIKSVPKNDSGRRRRKG
ncbi:Nucleolar protein 9 [Serendipita sp. 399]|nr:Nucleolar protein 9 [Serendipita sp. 399]